MYNILCCRDIIQNQTFFLYFSEIMIRNYISPLQNKENASGSQKLSWHFGSQPSRLDLRNVDPLKFFNGNSKRLTTICLWKNG